MCFQVKLPPQKEVVTSDELMAHLGERQWRGAVLSLWAPGLGVRQWFPSATHWSIAVLPRGSVPPSPPPPRSLCTASEGYSLWVQRRRGMWGPEPFFWGGLVGKGRNRQEGFPAWG